MSEGSNTATLRDFTRRSILHGGLAAALIPGVAHAAGTRSRVAAPAMTDVIVLGAGLSGLNAALLLEEQGLRVTVLEGRSRVGGRVFSLEDVDGTPDAGGAVIAPGYARLMDRAQQLAVPLKPIAPLNGGMAIHLEGQTIRAADWASSPLNPFPEGPLRAIPPFAVGSAALRSAPPAFQSVGDWRNPELFAQDISVASYLTAQGWTAQQLALAFATNPGYGNSASDLSVLMMWHIAENFRIMAGSGTQTFQAVGGNMRIPQAMAAALKNEVRLNQHVIGVRTDASGVEAVTLDGTVHRARWLLCTLPASAARTIVFAPALPLPQQAAIDGIGYNRTFQVFFQVAEPFWQADGLPAALWTDTSAGRLLPLGDPGGQTMLMAYVNGFRADLLSRLPAEQAVSQVQAAIERMRPAAVGKLRAVRHVNWQDDPFAGGAYTCWQPGQISAGMAAAFDDPVGRIAFAGEHTAALSRGMEGAMESGERAAIQLLERL
ncbi:NAD(P)/FAD-dependent oxidoreductase [Novosphingobium sp. ERW19]|uniref:flavin monoamine oxidase family protein n=1 Tax=Novosphingobium sp. ERW19 TaxID=2726186 RepID=UPI001456E0AD|nr:NAD(P)/FAD-dependent oxidoreductase [Novosphingobium sp. ERW19]NLR40262.1 NAD(P)-binding protein [Novosphingobium sp. ERW19]